MRPAASPISRIVGFRIIIIIFIITTAMGYRKTKALSICSGNSPVITQEPGIWWHIPPYF